MIVMNNDLLADIVRHSPDPIFSCDLHGVITSWNEAAALHFGLKAEVILGKSITTLEDFTRHFTVTKFSLPQGGSAFILKKNEVLSATKKLETILNQAPIILWATDNNGMVILSEGRGLEGIGKRPGELVGQSIHDIYKTRPQDLANVMKAIDGEVHHGDTWAGDIYFETYHAPLYDEDGNIIGMVGISKDSTERKLAEKALTETQEKLKSVLKHVPFAFWSVGLDRKFIFREGIGIQAMNMKGSEMVGKSIVEIYKDYPHVLEAMDRAFLGETLEMETWIGERFYNVTFAPIIERDGTVKSVSGITFDMTDRKKSENEKNDLLVREKSAVEASRLKSEFLANMSHEIRTPINGVLGMASLLMDTPLNQEQKEYADAILRSGDQLLTVINDILDFSKIEADKLDIEEISFNIHEVIHHTIKSFRILAQKKGIEVKSNLGNAVHQFVIGDPGRFIQIVNNLLNNAIKFTASGEVNVCVFTNAVDKNHVELKVEVKDTGVGIPKEVVEKLFQAFTQADSSTSRKFGGTGLGLSIAKNIVERMGGKIGVESEEGKGSTFWFTVTFKAGIPGISAPTTQIDSSYISAKPARILVADDVQVNQIITVKMLEKMGHKAMAVANGKEVLDALKTFQFDLILMDCQMPEMDGYEATRLIRQNENNGPRMTILAMTANAMKGDEEECIRAGMDGYIAKPISAKNLSAVVNHWLKLKASP